MLYVQSICSELEDMRQLVLSLASRQTIDNMSCAAVTAERPGLQEARCIGQSASEQVCLLTGILAA